MSQVGRPKTADPSIQSSQDQTRRIPTQAELAKAGQVDLLDKSGNKLLFDTLWSNNHHGDVSRRTIVVFIRHFNCEVSEKKDMCVCGRGRVCREKLSTRKTVPTSPPSVAVFIRLIKSMVLT
jgi:hypothetical protein